MATMILLSIYLQSEYMQRTKCHSIPVAASPLVNSILSVLFWIFDIDSVTARVFFLIESFCLIFHQLVHIWMLDCFHQVLHPLPAAVPPTTLRSHEVEEIDKAEQKYEQTRFDISKLMTVEKEVKNLEAKDTLALGKPLETSPMPGVKCPTCAANGQEVWVIPGRKCIHCGTHC